MGRVTSAGKEAKGAKTTPGCMEDEVCVLGDAVLAHPPFASLPRSNAYHEECVREAIWHSAQHAGEDERWAESEKRPDTSGCPGRASGRMPD